MLIAADDPASERFFESKIRPILSEDCGRCHGEEKQKGGLRLDHRSHLLHGGDTGPVMVPGSVEKSLLMEVVKRGDPDFSMPPKVEEALSAKKIDALEAWIAAGAHWPEERTAQIEERDAEGFTESERTWWAFQPIARGADPLHDRVPFP